MTATPLRRPVNDEYRSRYSGRLITLDGEDDDWRLERLYVAAYLLDLRNVEGIIHLADHEGMLSVQVNNNGRRDHALEKELIAVWEILNEYVVRVLYIQSRDMSWHEIT
jgi:hypothetical protein